MDSYQRKLDDKVAELLLARNMVSDKSQIESWQAAASQQSMSFISYLQMYGSFDAKGLDNIIDIAKDTVAPHAGDTSLGMRNVGSILETFGSYDDEEEGDVSESAKSGIPKELIDIYSMYVPDDVVRYNQSLNGDYGKTDDRQVSILFCDMRGYTRYCSTFAPQEVSMLINEFLAMAVECIEESDGFTYQYVGDEVTALFNAPNDLEYHGIHSMKAAILIQKRFAPLRDLWIKKGFQDPPHIGIGIHTGRVTITNIGPPHRRSFAALGYTINVAARMCSAAKAGEILLTQSTYEEVKGVPGHYAKAMPMPFARARRGPSVPAKGVSVPIESLLIEWNPEQPART